MPYRQADLVAGSKCFAIGGAARRASLSGPIQIE